MTARRSPEPAREQVTAVLDAIVQALDAAIDPEDQCRTRARVASVHATVEVAARSTRPDPARFLVERLGDLVSRWGQAADETRGGGAS